MSNLDSSSSGRKYFDSAATLEDPGRVKARTNYGVAYINSIEFMETAIGRPSLPPPWTPFEAINFKMSSPEVTCPQIVYEGGNVVSAYTKKNWLPLVFGPELAIATVPSG